MKKKIDTTLHYSQFIISRIITVATVGVLIYSIIDGKVGAIVFCSLFLIYEFFLLKKVFDKPTNISFDNNFIYLENGIERIVEIKLDDAEKAKLTESAEAVRKTNGLL